MCVNVYTRGGTPTFLLKKSCIYSYMFKLQSPSVLSVYFNTLIKTFFPLLNTAFEFVDFDAF